MNRSYSDISAWPTRGYIHGAIDAIERIHHANYHVSSIPADCRAASWRFPQLIYDLLNWWALDEAARIAFIGFPQSPVSIMLGWILERAQMGRRELTALNVAGIDYPRLTLACGQLAKCRILAQSAGFADAQSFYAQVHRIAAEFGVTRVLAHDCKLRNGRWLSDSPIPENWQATCDFLDLAVVLLGRHVDGVLEQPETAMEASRVTVLVVDDEECVRDCLGLILEHWGLAVLKAGTSEEALRLAGGLCVSLMISDIHRPGLNGLDFVPVFKQLHPNTPIILHSAGLVDDVRAKALKIGVAALVDKPCQLADFRSVLRRLGISICSDL